ncbi:hypothetical protein A2U01_0050204 [Trifolium medium]|uniref:Uncharacterized protein n=1 Tax=Trifolium medium TaxID=97028 RepID=A0A392QZK0_9FABA|nr:hypothetical protein [Trifolium medium]
MNPERQNGDDAAMVKAPEMQNDNDFNHSASEEVLEEEITQVHTAIAQNNTQTVDPDMPELVSDSEEEVVAETQIILQQPTLPQMVLDDMEKINKAWATRTYINTEEEVPFTPYVSKKTKKIQPTDCTQPWELSYSV